MSPTAIEVAARVAADHWSDAVESVELLAQSENAVFKVESADAGRFVLRLHRPGYNTLSEMQSEVAWVQALQQAGVATSVPMATLSGEHYVAVSVSAPPGSVEPHDQSDHSDHTVYAGAVEWVGGVPMESALEDDASLADSLYEQLGRIAGQIRSYSEAWEPPAGFVRRHWDADAFVGPDPLWGRFWESPALSADQRSVLTAARDHLRVELGGLPMDRGSYGMIHADFHLNNVMADAGTAVAIDFDDAGFGWYAHEIAVALYAAHGTPDFERARDALVAGYRQVHRLDDDELALVDTFFTVRSLMVVGWLTARPEIKPYAHLPEVTNGAVEQARHYLSTRG